MVTKRRKAWVNLYPDGRHTLYRTRKEALKIRALNSEGTVPMVERLPGDVVLSREQAELICRRLNDLYDVTVQDKHEIRALLRGRR